MYISISIYIYITVAIGLHGGLTCLIYLCGMTDLSIFAAWDGRCRAAKCAFLMHS